jgi:tRNA(fMet)-specific endonuclease VapC
VRYLLDTNAFSALMKGEPSVVERLRTTERGQVGVPNPVLAEIAYGIERLPRSRRRALLEDRFQLVEGGLPRVPWDDAVSEHFGRIKAGLERKGRRIEDFDVAIAAHAVATGGILVTADAGDMLRVPGLVVEDWSRA